MLSRLLVLGFALQVAFAAAQDAVVQHIPSADQALSAFATFDADPLNRLDATQPYLDFIRSSGEVHIILNDALLAWMYDDLDERNKAVLYAAFLGGNMAGQLKSGASGSDNVAGMKSALRAYRAIRAQQPDFTLPLFEQLVAADAAGDLATSVQQIVSGSSGE